MKLRIVLALVCVLVGMQAGWAAVGGLIQVGLLKGGSTLERFKKTAEALSEAASKALALGMEKALIAQELGPLYKPFDEAAKNDTVWSASKDDGSIKDPFDIADLRRARGLCAKWTENKEDQKAEYRLTDDHELFMDAVLTDERTAHTVMVIMGLRNIGEKKDFKGFVVNDTDNEQDYVDVSLRTLRFQDHQDPLQYFVDCYSPAWQAFKDAKDIRPYLWHGHPVRNINFILSPGSAEWDVCQASDAIKTEQNAFASRVGPIFEEAAKVNKAPSLRQVILSQGKDLKVDDSEADRYRAKWLFRDWERNGETLSQTYKFTEDDKTFMNLLVANERMEHTITGLKRIRETEESQEKCRYIYRPSVLMSTAGVEMECQKGPETDWDTPEECFVDFFYTPWEKVKFGGPQADLTDTL